MARQGRWYLTNVIGDGTDNAFRTPIEDYVDSNGLALWLICALIQEPHNTIHGLGSAIVKVRTTPTDYDLQRGIRTQVAYTAFLDDLAEDANIIFIGNNEGLLLTWGSMSGGHKARANKFLQDRGYDKPGAATIRQQVLRDFGRGESGDLTWTRSMAGD